MLALRKLQQGPGGIELCEVDEPTPGENQIKVRVEACGICGTDVALWQGLYPAHPPRTMGHEFGGVVEEAGPGVSGWTRGEKVVVEPTGYHCGECFYCLTGHYSMCPTRKALGHHMDGAFARYVIVNAQMVHRLPDAVPFPEAALLEPLACSAHGVFHETHVPAGELVVVVGPGPIGLLALKLLKVAGCTVAVCGVSRDRDRLALASRFGADEVVDVEHDSPTQVVNDLSGGLGAAMCVEAAGSAAALETCISLVRNKGTVLQLGIPHEPIRTDVGAVVKKEVQLKGSFAHTRDTWLLVLSLLGERKLDLQGLITSVRPLSQWKQSFQETDAKIGLKHVLVPEA